MNHDDSFSRRNLLTGAIVLGLGASGCASLPTVAGAGSGPGGAKGELPDFNDPAVNLKQIVRVQGSLKEEDVPWWFTGVIFGVRGDGETPRPLVRFEGMEIYWYKHEPDGYTLGGSTVTFFRDYETNEFINEFKNPYTGKVEPVKPAVQGGRVGFHYGVNGIKPAALKAQTPDKPLKLQWHALRDYVWMQNQTVYPPNMPPFHGQRQSMFVPRDKFLDDSIVALPTAFSSTVFMIWLKWMGMQGQPGHTIWHASGVKLRTIEDLPREYLDRARAEHGDRLSANPTTWAAPVSTPPKR